MSSLKAAHGDKAILGSHTGCGSVADAMKIAGSVARRGFGAATGGLGSDRLCCAGRCSFHGSRGCCGDACAADSQLCVAAGPTLGAAGGGGQKTDRAGGASHDVSPVLVLAKNVWPELGSVCEIHPCGR